MGRSDFHLMYLFLALAAALLLLLFLWLLSAPLYQLKTYSLKRLPTNPTHNNPISEIAENLASETHIESGYFGISMYTS